MISLIFSIFEKEEVIMENYAFYETYHNGWYGTIVLKTKDTAFCFRNG